MRFLLHVVVLLRNIWPFQVLLLRCFNVILCSEKGWLFSTTEVRHFCVLDTISLETWYFPISLKKKITIIRYQSFWIVVSSDLGRLLYSGNDQYSAKHLRGTLHRSLQCSLCILFPVVCMWILVTLVSLNSQLYFLNSRTPHRLYLGSLPLCCLQETVVGKGNERVQLICFPCLSNYCP